MVNTFLIIIFRIKKRIILFRITKKLILEIDLLVRQGRGVLHTPYMYFVF